MNQPSSQISIKRILKGLAITIPCTIMIGVIGVYYFNIISSYLNNKQSVVLGTQDTEDTFKPSLPEGYILIPKTIDNLEYKIKVGSRVERTFDLGNNNILTIKCPKVDKKDFVDIPSIPYCTVSLNNKIIYDQLRGDISCDDYNAESNCIQYISLALYKDVNLNNTYLFLTSGAGSIFLLSVYSINGNSYTQLSFGNDNEITLRGDPYYMAFTDESRREFRIITYYYDNTGEANSYYDLWKVANGRLALDREIIEK